MSRKLAVKSLTHSDLSFFETYFRRFPDGKQKAFNLDRNVIERTFFPSLTEVVDALPDRRALVTLTFFGPGLKGPHSLARKILKQEKNWRLNGELFPNPLDDPSRYDSLRPGDFAIMEFTGTGAPSSVRAVLISAATSYDKSLHTQLQSFMGASSMRFVSESDINQLVSSATVLDSHPLRDWIDGDLVEAVALGSGLAVETLNHRRRGRGMSAAELLRAKQAADKVGRLGEELLNYHFERRVAAFDAAGTASARESLASEKTGIYAVSSDSGGGLRAALWASQVNAVSPFDFELTTGVGEIRFADAKSTAGPFANPIHISIAELHFAIQSGSPYDIYRLFDVQEGSARLRIARNVAPHLTAVCTALASFPRGISVDSFTVDPSVLNFDSQILSIHIPDDVSDTDAS